MEEGDLNLGGENNSLLDGKNLRFPTFMTKYACEKKEGTWFLDYVSRYALGRVSKTFARGLVPR